MKTSGIVSSSLLSASLAGAIAIERRQLFGGGVSPGGASASVAGVGICLNLFGGCGTTTSTKAPVAAASVVVSPTVAPAAPAVPAAPVAPTTPAAPAAPVAPSAPAVPAAPVAPSAPAAPAAPVAPSAPAAPAAIVAPSAPAAPVAPSAPAAPAAPVVPSAPAAPVAPTTIVKTTSTSASATPAASPVANNAASGGYNPYNDGTLNSNTGYYGTGCPSAYGPNSWFPIYTGPQSRVNPLLPFPQNTYETTPNDVCTQMTFDIPSSPTGWKTCSFNVQVPSYYELSKDSLSYNGSGNFTFDGIADLIAPFQFQLPLINLYSTAPGQSIMVETVPCNIPANMETTVVSRLCSGDTSVKFSNTADNCKVGVYIGTTAN